jgi:ABC-type uncharacterized transport system substrate-binding protein
MTGAKSARPVGQQGPRRRELLLLLAGAITTAARAVRAQQKTPVIGFLGSTSPGLYAAHVAAFHEGLNETGYVEGQNAAIEYRWAEGQYDRLPALAAELVSQKVDVIAAGSAPSAMAAKNATSTIPIVFSSGGDPVAAGLVNSLARPGGNATGISILNAVYEWREFVVMGGLISYGASVTAPYRQAGVYVGRILKGAKPADLPVAQPMKFEMAVNLTTANSLGLAVPQTILARADEVIE